MRPSPSGDSHLYRQLLCRARPYTKQLAVLLLLDLLGMVLVLLKPLPLKIAVDSVIGARPLPRFLDWLLSSSLVASSTALLLLATGLVLALALLNSLQTLASSLLSASTREQLLLGFRGELFRHAQRLSLSYHDAEGTADSTYRIQNDAPAVPDILVDGLLPLLTSALTVALMLTITLWLDWQLGLVALGIAPFLLFLSGYYKQRLRVQSRKIKQLESGALSMVQEVLSVLRVVKAFCQEEREQGRFLQHSRSAMSARFRLLLAEGGYGLAVRLTTSLGTAAVLFIGVTHVADQKITLGDLLLVLGYLAQLYDPLKTISRKAASMQSRLASAERAFALLEQAPDVPERPDAQPLSRATGALTFRHVSFGYEKERPVLREVSFAIEPGTRLGIMGATGAGKTTLIHLLMRFYDPSQGQVLLDGCDLRGYRLPDLRHQFAIVQQEPVLFSGSIAENIAYPRPDATQEEIVAAARAAHAHDFILRLPDGYDTAVGERGMRLSGGERQRIALARAFLKDAPILLLDEPTSAVDGSTEAGILEAMEQLMHGRTSILITHREKPLWGCDRVLILDEGELVTLPPEMALLAGAVANG